MSESTPLLKEQMPSAPPGPQGADPPPQDAPPPYMQPQGPPPQSGQQTTIIVPNQQVIVTGVNFSDVPVRLRCPNCQNDVLTRLQYENGALVWLVVVILCLVGLWWGCCLIPLCIDSMKDVEHTCPVCNYQVGRFKRM